MLLQPTATCWSRWRCFGCPFVEALGYDADAIDCPRHGPSTPSLSEGPGYDADAVDTHWRGQSASTLVPRSAQWAPAEERRCAAPPCVGAMPCAVWVRFSLAPPAVLWASLLVSFVGRRA